MIKGKWRIDLGGKIKGAKSAALGSAVTKRGQDNSLQMCERCKYQTGEGTRLGGQDSGRGLRAPATLPGCRTPELPPHLGVAPLQRGSRGRETRHLESPSFRNACSISGTAWPAGLGPPRPTPASPTLSEVTGSNPTPGPRWSSEPRDWSRVSLGRRRLPSPDPVRLHQWPPRAPPPRRRGARMPAPARGRAGGRVPLRRGSLWRRCVRRSLCRGAGSRGMQMRQSRAGEARRGEPAGRAPAR